MKLREEILVMFYEENLTIGEIAGALHQDPHYVYEVVYSLRQYSITKRKGLQVKLQSLLFFSSIRKNPLFLNRTVEGTLYIKRRISKCQKLQQLFVSYGLQSMQLKNAETTKMEEVTKLNNRKRRDLIFSLFNFFFRKKLYSQQYSLS